MTKHYLQLTLIGMVCGIGHKLNKKIKRYYCIFRLGLFIYVFGSFGIGSVDCHSLQLQHTATTQYY